MLLDVQMHSQLLLGMDLQIQVRIASQWPPIADCLCAVYSTGTVHEANIGRKPNNKNQCGVHIVDIFFQILNKEHFMELVSELSAHPVQRSTRFLTLGTDLCLADNPPR